MKTHDGSFKLVGAPSDPWERAEWETLRQGAALTFRERLMWLEQASKLALQLKSAERKPLLDSEISKDD